MSTPIDAILMVQCAINASQVVQMSHATMRMPLFRWRPGPDPDAYPDLWCRSLGVVPVNASPISNLTQTMLRQQSIERAIQDSSTSRSCDLHQTLFQTSRGNVGTALGSGHRRRRAVVTPIARPPHAPVQVDMRFTRPGGLVTGPATSDMVDGGGVLLATQLVLELFVKTEDGALRGWVDDITGAAAARGERLMGCLGRAP